VSMAKFRLSIFSAWSAGSIVREKAKRSEQVGIIRIAPSSSYQLDAIFHCCAARVNPAAAVVRVEKYLKATALISQTTLRSVVGQVDLDQLLSQRVTKLV
jgi:hypothetical protein